jgi:hypothetical protein
VQVNIVSRGSKKIIKANPIEINPGIKAYFGFPLGRKTAQVNDPKEKNTGQKNKI